MRDRNVVDGVCGEREEGAFGICPRDQGHEGAHVFDELEVLPPSQIGRSKVFKKHLERIWLEGFTAGERLLPEEP